jgi:hypothetical protein
VEIVGNLYISGMLTRIILAKLKFHQSLADWWMFGFLTALVGAKSHNGNAILILSTQSMWKMQG